MPKYVKDMTEVWSLNNCYHNYRHMLPVFTRWYELHEWDYLKTWSEKQSGAKAMGAIDHFEVLNRLNRDVFTSEPLPGITRQHQISWVEVFRHFVQPTAVGAMLAANYFLGSPSLMLAHALWEHDQGYEIAEIRSYGIDHNDGDHAQQRQSWAYWCAQAHARGIEMTGTALAFMQEPERDAGLVGLREMIGDQLEATLQADGHRDYVIVSHHTDDPEYNEYANQLRQRCAELGIPVYLRNLGPVADYVAGVQLAVRSVMDTVEHALVAYKKPVIWMDIDDELLKAPTLPKGFDGFGYIQNPERQHYGDAARPIGSFFAVTPTEAGASAIMLMRPWEQATSQHRAVNALVAACDKWSVLAMTDISAHFRGCWKIIPNGKRLTECYT